MKDSELLKQSIEFSVLIIEYYKWLVSYKKEFIMSKQILKSATSIGANIHEAQYSISKADFINKIHISLKEASETEYWLIILEKTGYLSNEHDILKVKCLSLKKMLISSLNTIKGN
ncbi:MULTISPECIES: four helix bundle protein [unclassified Clostridium]|uniref:four helix bundle protein n=1 Tax=unclassified Clostridium TaxID=2614128 RepID=UPI0025C05C6F|nr:four helix bundle protein [Clostridium sp.]MDY4250992.1 four helix bundle protein [Clostridium sp.]